MVSDILLRCRACFKRQAVDQELDAELQFHLERQIQSYVEAGLNPADAARRARLEFGGFDQIREECRDAWGVRVVDDVWRDVRIGMRSMRTQPGLIAVAIVSLALGIAGNVLIFAFVTAVFFPTFPVRDQSRLMMIYSTTLTRSGQLTQYQSTSYLNATEYRDRNDVFAGLSVIVDSVAPLAIAGPSTPVLVNLINADYFDVLGVRPGIGRTLVPADEAPAATPAMVVSHALWTDRFGSDPRVLGTVVRLNQQSFTIVGVMPTEFRDVGAVPPADVWVPVQMHDQVLVGTIREWFTLRAARTATMVGRLKPGVSVAQADAAMRALGRQLEQSFPGENAGRNVMVVPLDRTVLGPAQRGLYIQAGVVTSLVAGLVLVIACVNVSHLLLARAVHRRREFAIRVSLGASPVHVVRQLLIESLLLASAGGGLGLVVSYVSRGGIERLLPGGYPPTLHVIFDSRVVLFTVGISLLTTLLFGLTPALRASGTGNIRPEQATSPARRITIRGPQFLVVAQVSLSLVAVFVAALFLRSLQKAQQAELGFDLERQVLAFVDLSPLHESPERLAASYETVVQRLRALPTVARVSLTDTPPLVGSYRRTTFSADVDTSDSSNGRLTGVIATTPGFFETAGMRLLKGRDFDEHDVAGTAMVAVVNEAAATALWPGADPLGQRLRFLLQDWDVRVVGLVNTVMDHALDEPPQPIIYLPFTQHIVPQAAVWVRAKGEPPTSVESIRASLASLFPALPPMRIRTGTDMRAQFLVRRRIGAQLLTVFGGLALLLASLGTFGVVSNAVGQRRRDIALSSALGASRVVIMRQMLAHSLSNVAVGLGVGLLIAALAARVLAGLLYGIRADDPMSMGWAVMLMLLTGLVACVVPVWRISRVDPVTVLRCD